MLKFYGNNSETDWDMYTYLARIQIHRANTSCWLESSQPYLHATLSYDMDEN